MTSLFRSWALLAIASSLLLLHSHGEVEVSRGNRILPYSLYLRRVEEQGQHHHPNVNGSFHDPFAEPSLFHSSVFGAREANSQQQQQSETSSSGKPVVIYLPAFANATSEHIATSYGVRQRDELGTEEALFRWVPHRPAINQANHDSTKPLSLCNPNLSFCSTSQSVTKPKVSQWWMYD